MDFDAQMAYAETVMRTAKLVAFLLVGLALVLLVVPRR